jgi:hypothetical protein
LRNDDEVTTLLGRATAYLRAGRSPFDGWARRLPLLALFATIGMPGRSAGSNAKNGTSVPTRILALGLGKRVQGACDGSKMRRSAQAPHARTRPSHRERERDRERGRSLKPAHRNNHGTGTGEGGERVPVE